MTGLLKEVVRLSKRTSTEYTTVIFRKLLFEGLLAGAPFLSVDWCRETADL